MHRWGLDEEKKGGKYFWRLMFVSGFGEMLFGREMRKMGVGKKKGPQA